MMDADKKAALLAKMPTEYKPNKPLEFVPLDMDKAHGFNMLSDAEAGQIIKRLFVFADDYTCCYDDTMQPDIRGLSDMAAFMLELLVNSFKRREDKRRETAFLRSGANDGGRPINGDKT